MDPPPTGLARVTCETERRTEEPRRLCIPADRVVECEWLIQILIAPFPVVCSSPQVAPLVSLSLGERAHFRS